MFLSSSLLKCLYMTNNWSLTSSSSFSNFHFLPSAHLMSSFVSTKSLHESRYSFSSRLTLLSKYMNNYYKYNKFNNIIWNIQKFVKYYICEQKRNKGTKQKITPWWKYVQGKHEKWTYIIWGEFCVALSPCSLVEVSPLPLFDPSETVTGL